jgi:hypothetical protein
LKFWSSGMFVYMSCFLHVCYLCCLS